MISLPTFHHATVSVCFTPQQRCRRHILDLIRSAKQAIYMQAFSFTSDKIAKALVRKAHQGVSVDILLDKINFNCRQYSESNYLLKHGVHVWEDYLPNNAHNKILIVDGKAVETGSYNYSVSAQFYNAENVLFITSRPIAALYLKNWRYRRHQSRRMRRLGCYKQQKQSK